MLIEHVQLEREAWHIRTFTREFTGDIFKMFHVEVLRPAPELGRHSTMQVAKKGFPQYSWEGLRLAIFLSAAKYDRAIINRLHITRAGASKYSLGAADGVGLELTDITMKDGTVYTVNLGLTEVF
jgi:hypothetical protein